MIQQNELVSPRGGVLPRSQPDCAELFLRLRRGDREAFRVLVARWEKTVYGIARRVTGDHFSAEDVRQGVFLRLLLAPEKVRQPERLGAWLRRVVINDSIDLLRKKRRRTKTEESLQPGMAGDAPADGDLSPEDSLEAREESERLERALAHLKPAERALVTLRFDEDLTFAEISAVIGRPASTVKSRIQKCVQKLKKHLTEET